MSYSFANLLDPEVLSTPYREFSSTAAGPNPLLDYFAGPKVVKNHNGHSVTVRVLTAVKDPAPFNPRGAVARTLTPQTAVKEKTFTCLHSFNQMTLPQDPMEFLQELDSPLLQENAARLLQQHMEEFGA
ncbi:MAG: hypothetical protein ACRDD1_03315, partial [Planctomycetia bacterium]